VCMYVSMYMCVCGCLWLCVCMSICVYVCLCMSVYLRVCLFLICILMNCWLLLVLMMSWSMMMLFLVLVSRFYLYCYVAMKIGYDDSGVWTLMAWHSLPPWLWLSFTPTEPISFWACVQNSSDLMTMILDFRVS